MNEVCEIEKYMILFYIYFDDIIYPKNENNKEWVYNYGWNTMLRLTQFNWDIICELPKTNDYIIISELCFNIMQVCLKL